MVVSALDMLAYFSLSKGLLEQLLSFIYYFVWSSDIWFDFNGCSVNIFPVDCILGNLLK